MSGGDRKLPFFDKPHSTGSGSTGLAQATESEAGTRPLGRKTVYLHESDAETYLSLTGFSAREPEGRCGPTFVKV